MKFIVMRFVDPFATKMYHISIISGLYTMQKNVNIETGSDWIIESICVIASNIFSALQRIA